VITPQALNLLRGHYKRKEIENVNLPRDDKKEVNVAKTTIGSSEEAFSARDIMEDLRTQALIREREKSQIGPSKSSMRKPSSPPRPMSPTVEDDDDGMEDLDEPGIDDSFSANGSEGTVEIPRREEPMKGNMRSVNFG